MKMYVAIFGRISVKKIPRIDKWRMKNFSKSFAFWKVRTQKSEAVLLIPGVNITYPVGYKQSRVSVPHQPPK
jgi:hypothetical protein